MRLTDGTHVEVRPRTDDALEEAVAPEAPLLAEGKPEGVVSEDAFKQRLRAEGRLAPVVTGTKLAPHIRYLLDVQGQPLSEQIIVERR